MPRPTKQIQALKNAAQAKRELSIEKVKITLQKMHADSIPISIGSVAKLASVSRTWLYNNPKLKNEIISYRSGNDKVQRIVDLQSMINTRDKKIDFLKQRNRNLQDIIKKLRKQLEVVYGELYKLKN